MFLRMHAFPFFLYINFVSWRFLSGNSVSVFDLSSRFSTFRVNMASRRSSATFPGESSRPPFLSLELELQFGCRTKVSQGYHLRNTIAWSTEVVEIFQGSFRLNFDDVIVYHTGSSSSSRRTALSSGLSDCYDCSQCTEPLLFADQYLSLPNHRILPLRLGDEELSTDLRRFRIEPRKCIFPNCQRIYMYFTARDSGIVNDIDGGRRFIVMKIPRFDECDGIFHYFCRCPRSFK